MSLNTYDSSSGTLTNIASSSRIWTGTKDEWNALVQAGTAPRNTIVMITDDEDDTITTAVTEDDSRAVTSGGVYNVIKSETIPVTALNSHDTSGIVVVHKKGIVQITGRIPTVSADALFQFDGNNGALCPIHNGMYFPIAYDTTTTTAATNIKAAITYNQNTDKVVVTVSGFRGKYLIINVLYMTEEV